MRVRAALWATALAAIALVAPGRALASRGQLTMIEDDKQVLDRGPAQRAAALDEMKALGTDVVKLRVVWRQLAPRPDSESAPTFNARDPGAYPQGAWANLDAAIRAIDARGMQPLLMVGPPAPEWATRKGELLGHQGVMEPSPAQFARFAQAIGRRYSGRYRGLPRVSLWSIWNEPNHPLFLQPLWKRMHRQWVPLAADLYRGLYVAARKALARTGHDRDHILFGEILPVGMPSKSPVANIKPLIFLREFFCVDSHYRPYRGRAAAIRGCKRFPKIRTSGFAYHAYVRPLGPRAKLDSPDDATIAQIRNVDAAFDLIARTGRIQRHLPIWDTEFGVRTHPPNCIGLGASLKDQAAFMNEAEYDSYVDPRVKTYSNYQLEDDPVRIWFPPGTTERYGGYQTGLRWGPNAVVCESPQLKLPPGQPKQPAYDAFRTPIYVRRLPRGGVQVFGRARPRGYAPQRIEILHNGRRVESVVARRYFLVTLRQRPTGRWQLRWRFRGVTYRSRVAKALPDYRPPPLPLR